MTTSFKFNPFTGNFDIVTASIDLSTSDVTGVLPETKGGTNQSTYTTGDLLYASASNTLSKRTIGSAGDVLTVAGGVPTWAPVVAATPNYQISSSSGTFSTASASFVDITNLSVTITTTGRPVILKLVADGDTGAGNAGQVQVDSSSATASGYIAFLEGSTMISQLRTVESDTGNLSTSQYVPCSAFNHFYVPAAGTYTYKAQAALSTGSGISVIYTKLVAYEI